MAERTHYETIDADPTASKADLRAAYSAALESAQTAGNTDEVAAVRRAWQVLSDPVQRQRYDEQIGVGHRGAAVSTRAAAADEALDDDDDVVEAEVLEDDDELAPEPIDRRALFANVPEFLEQPTIGRRLTASLIDVVTLAAVSAASVAVAVGIMGSDTARFVAALALLEIWLIALFVVPTIRTGQTLGKRFTYVMTVDRLTGNLPTVSQVIRRYMIPIVAFGATAMIGQLGPFIALFFGLSYAMSRDQLSLADRLAQTVVVVARYKPTRGA